MAQVNYVIAQRRNAAETRRRQVVELRLAGHVSALAIAEKLGVSERTIRTDFKLIDAEWRAQSTAEIAVEKTRQSLQIDELIKSLWADATADDDRKRNWAIDRVIGLFDRKAKLLGLDAPIQVNLRSELEAEARRLAVERGLDLDVVMAQVEEILAAAERRR